MAVSPHPSMKPSLPHKPPSTREEGKRESGQAGVSYGAKHEFGGYEHSTEHSHHHGHYGHNKSMEIHGHGDHESHLAHHGDDRHLAKHEARHEDRREREERHEEKMHHFSKAGDKD